MPMNNTAANAIDTTLATVDGAAYAIHYDESDPMSTSIGVPVTFFIVALACLLMCCLVLVLLFYWYQRNDLIKMMNGHGHGPDPAKSRSITMDSSPYNTPQSTHTLHTSEGSMPTLPAIPSLHPQASAHTVKTKTTLPSIPDESDIHKRSKTSHLSVAMPWDTLFQKHHSVPQNSHSPPGIAARVSPASVPYHHDLSHHDHHEQSLHDRAHDSHHHSRRHRRHVTAGNQRYAAIRTNRTSTNPTMVEMPELTEVTQMEPQRAPPSPSMPAISPMADSGAGAALNGPIPLSGPHSGPIPGPHPGPGGVASVPPPAAFQELHLQRHNSHHMLRYPHPAFAPHSQPPIRVNRGNRAKSMQIGRRQSNRISHPKHSVHTLNHRGSESYAVNPVRALAENHEVHHEVHEMPEIQENHGANPRAMGHHVHFEENHEPPPHRTVGPVHPKPIEVMTVINTEARTVLSDVTSSSSGESTDHADDDQFDSVSTRMKSERKFGRRKKHKKHYKMDKYKEERLQGVLEEEVVEELNALKTTPISHGFRPSRKNTEFSEDDRYVD